MIALFRALMGVCHAPRNGSSYLGPIQYLWELKLPQWRERYSWNKSCAMAGDQTHPKDPLFTRRWSQPTGPTRLIPTVQQQGDPFMLLFMALQEDRVHQNLLAYGCLCKGTMRGNGKKWKTSSIKNKKIQVSILMQWIRMPWTATVLSLNLH